MSSTPKELIDCAAAMVPLAQDEPMYRAVCNRAYYGAYHSAKAFHDKLPAPGTVGGAKGRHEQLIAQLGSPMISKQNKKYYVSQALGKSLRILADVRVRADYTITNMIDQGTASQAAADAQALYAASI